MQRSFQDDDRDLDPNLGFRHTQLSSSGRSASALRAPFTGRVPPQFSLLTHFLPGLILDLASVPIPIGAGTKFVEWVRPGFVQPDL